MKDNGLDPRLKNAFNELENIPPRDPQVAALGRINFLKQATAFQQSDSRIADQSLNKWSNTNFPLFQRKKGLPLLNTIITIVLVVAVFFGGAGASVYAAQESLPDQVLYPVKTWSEDVILSLTESHQMRLNQALDFSDRRVAEITSLLAAGKPIPRGFEIRLQNELDLVLELAAGMDDLQMVKELELVRHRAETQLQAMTLLVPGAPESEKPLLLMTQVRLQEQIQLAVMGESDLPGFRMQIQQRFQNQRGSGEQPTDVGHELQGPGTQSPNNTPPPSGTGNGPGSGGNKPAEVPGYSGPDSQSPVQTPLPGRGFERRP
jgi:hypothetical protein